MRRTLLLSLALLAVPLTGCLGDDTAEGPAAGTVDETLLSSKRFEVLPVEEVWVPSSQDGKRLHNAVYRPDTDEPVPVFINFSPYWGDSAEEGGDNFARYLVDEYVPRGYAVVLSAVRGTGHSEGCFQIAGDLELQDTYDVIDHFAGTAWSTGAVAAGGKSYDSTTQNGLIAKTPHEALEGIFHVSGITDMYRYNYRNGLPYGHGTIFNTYYYFQGTDEYGIGLFERDTDALADDDPESLARIVDDAACTEFPLMQASGLGSGAHGMKDAYWIERDWNRYIPDSSWDGNIFFLHGLQDWNVKPDHILPWLELLPEEIEVYGWLHQWSREPEGGHVYPMRTDWNLTMLRWLDHTLKGIDTGLFDEPAFQSQGSDGLWRVSEAWPPRDVVTPQAGLPLDALAPVEGEPGRTVWEGAVLTAGEDPVRYAGAPTVHITATAVTGDPVLTAVLYDEAPGGTRTWVNEAALRAVYRNGLEAPEPVQPGTTFEVALEMYPQDDVLAPGHSWVLALGALPTYVEPTREQLTGVTYELTGATLELPYASVGALLAEQPGSMDCIAC